MSARKPDIIAVSRDAAYALTDDDRILPITSWIDCDGDPCAPEEAVSCVAGMNNEWFAIDLSCFERLIPQ